MNKQLSSAGPLISQRCPTTFLSHGACNYLSEARSLPAKSSISSLRPEAFFPPVGGADLDRRFEFYLQYTSPTPCQRPAPVWGRGLLKGPKGRHTYMAQELGQAAGPTAQAHTPPPVPTLLQAGSDSHGTESSPRACEAFKGENQNQSS